MATSERTALYRLFDVHGELLYVGITWRFLPVRMGDHAATQSWWQEVHHATAIWYETREEADAAETDAIGLERPKYNKAKAMDVLNDPEQLPRDDSGELAPDAIPDNTMIGVQCLAVLQNVTVQTVYRYNTAANARRRSGTPKSWDLPPPDGQLGISSWWYMSTYRAWVTRRPGAGAGAGRKPGRQVRRRTACLPITVTCPCGCEHEFMITESMVRNGTAQESYREPGALAATTATAA